VLDLSSDLGCDLVVDLDAEDFEKGVLLLRGEVGLVPARREKVSSSSAEREESGKRQTVERKRGRPGARGRA
jgi:hypothetical protein